MKLCANKSAHPTKVPGDWSDFSGEWLCKSCHEKWLAKKYPWFVRPRPGHFHCVEFGTVYRSNGSTNGVKCAGLNHDEKHAASMIERAIAAGRREMHVHHDGTIVDVMGKDGASVRKDKDELWEEEPCTTAS